VQGSQAPTATANSSNAGKTAPPGGFSATNPRPTIAANSLNTSTPTATSSQANASASVGHDGGAGRDGSAQGTSAPATTATPFATPGKSAAAGTKQAAGTSGTDGQTSGARADVHNLVAQLNKVLNDSGRPDQFRVDPQSGATIQEVNPANGEVIAQFAASEFPALARSVGASGLLFDSRA
jgi:uncharacterized FlaG/YvyC family protein